MSEINIADIITIVLAQTPVDSGFMIRNVAEFFDTPYEIVVEYNTSTVPYIIYQEEGFKHYRSGKMVTKNKGFISQKTTGQLNRYGWSNALGIPFNMLENEQRVLDEQDNIMLQMGVVENV